MEERMFTRRKFLQLAALGVAGGVIVACTPKSPETPAAPTQAPTGQAAPTQAPAEQATPAATPAPEKVELRWLDWSDMDDIVNNTITTFKERFPNVTVEFEPIGDAWGEKQLTQMISGTAPDILNGNDYCCYIWAERKQLVDLNPLVERDLTKEQISDFFDHHWQGLVYPGTGIRMGIANYAWVYQYYFNKDAFDQAGLSYPKTGWTVDDMSAALEALTKRDASGKVTRWGGGDAVYNAARIQLWLRIFGGYLVDPGDWTHCVLDSDESKQALEWHRHRIWDANSLVQSIQVADYQSLDNLALGTVAIQGECNGVLYSLLGEPPGFRWGTVAPPAGRNGQTITQGTIDSYMIWTGSKAKDIAWEFVKLLTVEDDFQLATSALWGCTPNRKSLLPRFVDAVRQEYPDVEDDQIQPQVDMLLDAQVTLRAQFKRQKASEELIAPVLEKIFIVGDTPVTAVGALAEEVTALNREQ